MGRLLLRQAITLNDFWLSISSLSVLYDMVTCTVANKLQVGRINFKLFFFVFLIVFFVALPISGKNIILHVLLKLF